RSRQDGPRASGPGTRGRGTLHALERAGAGAVSDMVLYRCPNRTNVLCPCGAVARRLRRLGLEYRTERVPYRRSSRPEIEELTRQRRVPVLVDGDEVIHDSRRIVQYLEWRYRPKARGEDGKAERPSGEVRPAAPQETERAAAEGGGPLDAQEE